MWLPSNASALGSLKLQLRPVPDTFRTNDPLAAFTSVTKLRVKLATQTWRPSEASAIGLVKLYSGPVTTSPHSGAPAGPACPATPCGPWLVHDHPAPPSRAGP